MLTGEYARLIRKSWVAVLGGLLLGLLCGLVYALAAPKTYESTATALVSYVGANSADDLAASGGFIDSRVKTYASVVRSPLVLDKVIAALDLDTDAPHLANRIEAEPLKETALIEITASASDPGEATRIANEIAKVFQSTLPGVDAGTKVPLLKVTITEPAVQPASPASPILILDVLLGGTVGVLLVLTGLFARGSRTLRQPLPHQLAEG